MNLTMKVLRISFFSIVLSVFSSNSFGGICQCKLKSGSSINTSDHMTNPNQCNKYKDELAKSNANNVQTCVFSATGKCGSRNGYPSEIHVPSELLKAQTDIDKTLCSKGTVTQIKLMAEIKKFSWLCTDGKETSTVDCWAPIK